MTSETLNRYNSAMAKVVILKIDIFLKKHLVSISCYVLLSEKLHFRRFISQNVLKNHPFFRHFRIFQAALKAYLASMTPSTSTPGPGAPPANSQRTKQFWSLPRGL
jgi:hypothetical protein